MSASAQAPISIALVDDYDVVLIGLAHMLEPYDDRVVVKEIDAEQPVQSDVDIVLYDTFAQPEADHDRIRVVIDHPHASRVVVYTWNFAPGLVEQAVNKGVSGYLSKTLAGGDLVDALEKIHAGERIISEPPRRVRPAPELDWPGRAEGLTNRESEVLALITQGHSNAEIAATMFLSPNSIKAYIRSAYQKIGVGSRTQAVLWGVEHGFTPDHNRIETWRLPAPASHGSPTADQD
jgi:DNA-binding NarL/FixJ family response regulator